MISNEDWLKAEAQISNAYTVQYRREILYSAQEGICAICGDLIIPKASIDHVIPKAKGGVDKLGNLLATHYRCNNTKADNIPTGCQLVWLLAVNSRLGVYPQKW